MQANYRKLLYLSYAGFIVIGIGGAALNIAWIHIQDDFGLTLGALGVLLTVRSVGRLFISFYSGAIISRIGIGMFMLIGSVVAVVGLGIFALAPTWGILIAAGIILGPGTSAIINGVNTFVASNYNSRHMNWLHASFGLGMMVGPMLVTIIVIDMGLSWRWSYALITAGMAVIVLLFFATRKEWILTSRSGNHDKPKEGRSGSMRDTLRRPIVWLGFAIFFFATSSEVSTGQFSNSLFVEGRNLDAKTVGIWISLYYLAFTIGRIFTGIVIDRVNHNLFLRANMFGTIIGAMLIWANFGELWSFAGLLLMGFTLSPTAPTLFSDTPNRVGAEQTPNAMGFQNFGAGLGLAFPPALAAALAEMLGLEFIGLFLAVVAIITFVLHEALLFRERQTEIAKQLVG